MITKQEDSFLNLDNVLIGEHKSSLAYELNN